MGPKLFAAARALTVRCSSGQDFACTFLLPALPLVSFGITGFPARHDFNIGMFVCSLSVKDRLDCRPSAEVLENRIALSQSGGGFLVVGGRVLHPIPEPACRAIVMHAGPASGGKVGCIPSSAVSGIDLVKQVNGQDANAALGPTVPVGSTVTFTYVVRNTGN